MVRMIFPKGPWEKLKNRETHGPGGGGGGEHLGIFWVGMCRPGYKIDTPF